MFRPGIARILRFAALRTQIGISERLHYTENVKKDKTSIHNKTAFVVAVILLITILIGTVAGFVLYATASENDDPHSKSLLGVWWWDNRLDSSYLDFAKENGVTEIYCYYSSFNQKTSDFIRSAAEKDIDVLWLAGKYEWIEDYGALKDKIVEYMLFQQSSDHKFKGVHLDIEPHLHPDFEEKRVELITAFVNLTFSLKNDFPDLRIEYDIPFWLDDEVTANGITKPAYQFVIDNASRVTVMSYRDSAQKILDCAKEETEYAVHVGKPLNLSAETGENEDVVTFFEEGNEFMLHELSLVRQSLPDGFGIAVHHIKDWRALAKKQT